MSVAQKLPEVHPFFVQKCPMCGRDNRMVVKGVYKNGEKQELYPDIGYSFCNCTAIFYTRPENVVTPYCYEPDEKGIITAPDPFFCEWGNNPYSFPHWNPRKFEILWDMDSFCEYITNKGILIENAWRDFEINSATPMSFHVKVRV